MDVTKFTEGRHVYGFRRENQRCVVSCYRIIRYSENIVWVVTSDAQEKKFVLLQKDDEYLTEDTKKKHPEKLFLTEKEMDEFIEKEELRRWIRHTLETKENGESYDLSQLLAVRKILLGESLSPKKESHKRICVKTPKGVIEAREIPDETYPGISLCYTKPGSGEPGAILEYTPKYDDVVLWVYDVPHADDDPLAAFSMTEDKRYI